MEDNSRKDGIVIPFGWKRSVDQNNGTTALSHVTYRSPSGTVLSSIAEICQYLENNATCKCGLQCPLHVPKVFSFNPQVRSLNLTKKEWVGQDKTSAGHSKSCAHWKAIRRKYFTKRKKTATISALEPPPKLLIIRKGGQLTSVIPDKKSSAPGAKESKKPKSAKMNRKLPKVIAAASTASMLSRVSPLKSPLFESATNSKSGTDKNTTKSKSEFKLQWIKADDESSHNDAESGNELCFSPDFKKSPPISLPHSLLSSITSQTSTHYGMTKATNSIMSGSFFSPTSSMSGGVEPVHRFGMSAFPGSNFMMKSFDSNTPGQQFAVQRHQGPVPRYPQMMMKAEHDSQNNPTPYPVSGATAPFPNNVGMRPSVMQDAQRFWQQGRAMSMGPGAKKQQPGMRWSGMGPNFTPGYQSGTAGAAMGQRNQLPTVHETSPMRPGTPKQFSMGSPPPCNPTSPFSYPGQGVVGASPGHGNSPFSNRSHSRSSSMGQTPSPLQPGQWQSCRVGFPNDTSRPQSRSSNVTTPRPSASPSPLQHWAGVNQTMAPYQVRPSGSKIVNADLRQSPLSPFSPRQNFHPQQGFPRYPQSSMGPGPHFDHTHQGQFPFQEQGPSFPAQQQPFSPNHSSNMHPRFVQFSPTGRYRGPMVNQHSPSVGKQLRARPPSTQQMDGLGGGGGVPRQCPPHGAHMQHLGNRMVGDYPLPTLENTVHMVRPHMQGAGFGQGMPGQWRQFGPGSFPVHNQPPRQLMMASSSYNRAVVPGRMTSPAMRHSTPAMRHSTPARLPVVSAAGPKPKKPRRKRKPKASVTTVPQLPTSTPNFITTEFSEFFGQTNTNSSCKETLAAFQGHPEMSHLPGPDLPRLTQNPPIVTPNESVAKIPSSTPSLVIPPDLELPQPSDKGEKLKDTPEVSPVISPILPTLFSPQPEPIELDAADAGSKAVADSIGVPKAVTRKEPERRVNTPPLPLLSPNEIDDGNNFSYFGDAETSVFDFDDSAFGRKTKLEHHPSSSVETGKVENPKLTHYGPAMVPSTVSGYGAMLNTISTVCSSMHVVTVHSTSSATTCMKMEPQVSPALKQFALATTLSQTQPGQWRKSGLPTTTPPVSIPLMSCRFTEVTKSSFKRPSSSKSTAANTRLVSSSGKVFQVPDRLDSRSKVARRFSSNTVGRSSPWSVQETRKRYLSDPYPVAGANSPQEYHRPYSCTNFEHLSTRNVETHPHSGLGRYFHPGSGNLHHPDRQQPRGSTKKALLHNYPQEALPSGAAGHLVTHMNQSSTMSHSIRHGMSNNVSHASNTLNTDKSNQVHQGVRTSHPDPQGVAAVDDPKLNKVRHTAPVASSSSAAAGPSVPPVPPPLYTNTEAMLSSLSSVNEAFPYSFTADSALGNKKVAINRRISNPSLIHAPDVDICKPDSQPYSRKKDDRPAISVSSASTASTMPTSDNHSAADGSRVKKCHDGAIIEKVGVPIPTIGQTDKHPERTARRDDDASTSLCDSAETLSKPIVPSPVTSAVAVISSTSEKLTTKSYTVLGEEPFSSHDSSAMTAKLPTSHDGGLPKSDAIALTIAQTRSHIEITSSSASVTPHTQESVFKHSGTVKGEIKGSQAICDNTTLGGLIDATIASSGVGRNSVYCGSEGNTEETKPIKLTAFAETPASVSAVTLTATSVHCETTKNTAISTNKISVQKADTMAASEASSKSMKITATSTSENSPHEVQLSDQTTKEVLPICKTDTEPTVTTEANVHDFPKISSEAKADHKRMETKQDDERSGPCGVETAVAEQTAMQGTETLSQIGYASDQVSRAADEDEKGEKELSMAADHSNTPAEQDSKPSMSGGEEFTEGGQQSYTCLVHPKTDSTNRQTAGDRVILQDTSPPDEPNSADLPVSSCLLQETKNTLLCASRPSGIKSENRSGVCGETGDNDPSTNSSPKPANNSVHVREKPKTTSNIEIKHTNKTPTSPEGQILAPKTSEITDEAHSTEKQGTKNDSGHMGMVAVPLEMQDDKPNSTSKPEEDKYSASDNPANEKAERDITATVIEKPTTGKVDAGAKARKKSIPDRKAETPQAAESSGHPAFSATSSQDANPGKIGFHEIAAVCSGLPPDLSDTVIRQLSNYNTLLKNLLVSGVGPIDPATLGFDPEKLSGPQANVLAVLSNQRQIKMMSSASSVNPAMLLFQDSGFHPNPSGPGSSGVLHGERNIDGNEDKTNTRLQDLKNSKHYPSDSDESGSYSSDNQHSKARQLRNYAGPPRHGVDINAPEDQGTSDTTQVEPCTNPADGPSKVPTSAHSVQPALLEDTANSPRVSTSDAPDCSGVGSFDKYQRRSQTSPRPKVESPASHQGLQVPIVSSSVKGSQSDDVDEDTYIRESNTPAAPKQKSPVDEVSTSHLTHESPKHVAHCDVTSEESTSVDVSDPYCMERRRGRSRTSAIKQSLRKPEASATPEKPLKRVAAASGVSTSNYRSAQRLTGSSERHKIVKSGDLVWGQMRGFPSWPGKVVKATEVRGIQQRAPLPDGKVWVKWFGDHTFAQMNPAELRTMTEGLEAHHRSRKKGRTRNRKISIHLETAIQEAVDELEQQQDLRQKKTSGGVPPLLPSGPTLQPIVEPPEPSKQRSRGRKRKAQ